MSIKCEADGGGDQVPLASLGEIVDGGAREVAHPALPETHLILVRQGEQVHAYLNVCPHAGRALSWAPGQFLFTPAGKLVCAAHGATFEPDSGLCVGGPCIGASLSRVPVRVEQGSIFLDQETPLA